MAGPYVQGVLDPIGCRALCPGRVISMQSIHELLYSTLTILITRFFLNLLISLKENTNWLFLFIYVIFGCIIRFIRAGPGAQGVLDRAGPAARGMFARAVSQTTKGGKKGDFYKGTSAGS